MDVSGYILYFCRSELLFKGWHAFRRSLADDAHMVFYRIAVNKLRSEEAGADAALKLFAVADGAGFLIDSLSSCYGLHPLMPGGFRAFPFFVRRRLKYLMHLHLFFILRLLRPACGLRKKQVQVKQPKADESQEQDGHAEGHPFFAFLAFLYAVEFIHMFSSLVFTLHFSDHGNRIAVIYVPLGRDSLHIQSSSIIRYFGSSTLSFLFRRK